MYSFLLVYASEGSTRKAKTLVTCGYGVGGWYQAYGRQQLKEDFL